MNDNVRQIFNMLGVEPNERFKVDGLLGGNHIFTIDENLIISDDSETIHIYLLTSLLTGDCKIIKLPKEPKKKKLRDLTPEEWNKWKDKNCSNANCNKCFFDKVNCFGTYSNRSWFYNKDLFSNRFLDQEIEVEE